MNKPDGAAAIFLMIFGGGAFAVARTYPIGSRMFPMFYAATLFVLALLLLFQSICRSRHRSESSDTVGAEPFRKVFSVLFFILLYITLIPYIGFYLSTLCFLFASILLSHAAKPLASIVVSIGTTGAIYLFFDMLLKLQTPAGIFF